MSRGESGKEGMMLLVQWIKAEFTQKARDKTCMVKSDKKRDYCNTVMCLDWWSVGPSKRCDI